MKKSPLILLLAAFVSTATAADPAIGFETKRLSDQFFSEGASFGDIDGDGVNDLVSGPFWYAGPDFSKRHEIYAPKPFDPAVYSDNFFSFTHDLNGDDHLDVLVLGFPGKEAVWFENPGSTADAEHWPRHVVFDVVDNESPGFGDLTGDGKPEIICSSGGVFGYVTPDWAEPTKPWTFHPISGPEVAGGRFTHGLGIGDVNGDGRADLLEKTSWWQQPESLEGDPVWKRHRFAFSGPGGSQMHAYDFDGDGDNDIVTSLAAHGWGLAWYEQVVDDTGKRGFEKHLIMGQTPAENSRGVAFSQTHALALADIDGDGISDLVTGKRWWAHRGKDPGGNDAAVLYWFRTVRDEKVEGGVDFVPHLIDDDSGVGTDVIAEDIDGDGLVDVLVGNKKGSFVHLQRRGEALKNAQGAKPSTPALRPPQRKPFVDEGQSADDALKGLSLYEGFKAQLIAAEPEVTQPIAMTFDARGRLWVAEAHTYPVRAPEGEGKDRIVIFEDADHDGSFESRKVFTEGLNLVSGLEVGFGGVWVGAAPYLLFIPDKDQNDEPDGEPEIVLDGFGYQDTHETLNAFTWGPDGWLYGCHGVFTHSKVGAPGTPDDQRVGLNCGVWRFHPTQKNFEVFAFGTSNPWGVDFDDRGQAFISACVIPHLYHMIQGGRYQRQGGKHFSPFIYDDIKTIADHSHFVGSIRDHAHWGKRPDAPTDTLAAGGGHAHCGLAIYLGDNFPEQFRGALLFNNLHGHGMNHDAAVPRGSGFVGQHRPDFLASNDRWHMGVSTRVGPDGALYLSDWYDEQVCHNREAEIWDRDNGRIYRISYGDPQATAVDLAALSDADLVEKQLHANDWHVRTARRLLQERASAGTLDVAATTQGLWKILHDSNDETRQLRALWALHVIDGLTTADHAALLSNASPDVRAWTLQLIGEKAEPPSKQLLNRIVEMARSDASPVVRLYIAAQMQRVPHVARKEVLSALAKHGEDAADHNLPLMIWYAVEPLVTENPAWALDLADATTIPLVQQHILRRLAEDEGGRDSLLTHVLDIDGQAQDQTAIAVAIAAALEARVSAPMPESWEAARAALEKIDDPGTRQLVENLGLKFGDRSMLPKLREIAADVSQKKPRRLAAIDSLVEARDAEAVPVFFALARGANPPLRGHVIRSLASFTDERTPEVLLTLYRRLEPDEKSIVVEVLASNRHYALALLAAVEADRVPRADLGAFAVRQLQALNDKEVTASLEKNWGLLKETSGDKRELLKRYRRLMSDEYLSHADVSNGRRLYNQSCFACHTLFGEGNALGPDITGSNRMDLDYLLENILDPSALVGRDYQLTLLTLKDGRVVSGMVRDSSDDALTVAMIGGAEQLVALADIAKRETLQASMMPEGQLAALPDDDARDLIAYLQSPQQARLSEAGEIFFEGEKLKAVSGGSGQARPQKLAHYNGGSWEGDAHLWWTGAKPGERLVLEFTVPEEGVYALSAAMTKARDYGRFKLWLDEGEGLVDEIDLFNSPDVVSTGEVNFGEHVLSAGPHRLVVSVTGANPKAVKGYMFGLDYLRLVKKPQP